MRKTRAELALENKFKTNILKKIVSFSDAGIAQQPYCFWQA
jgi:hypothetical protein